MTVTILTGDCRDVLATLPDRSVQCCVTSPPYFGLRDYGHDGQIGLEQTPDAYVAEMVAVFREVRRVLRDDGVCFINLGDSYHSGSGPTAGGCSPKSTLGGGGGRYRKGSKNEAMHETGGGARRAIACDTSGTEPEGSPADGCLCGSLCGACRAAYRIGKSHSGCPHAPTPVVSTVSSIPEHTGSTGSHPPTSDYVTPADRIADAIPGRHVEHGRVPSLPAASQVSTLAECVPLPLAARSPVDAVSGCRLCGQTLPPGDPGSDRNSACTCDTGSQSDASGQSKTGRFSSGLAYPDYTTASRAKPKDLLGIPWLVAFALRADGWYLRQDIIWAKPNPMPESVTDRCTKAHEYVFLLSKSPRYFYDAKAVAEESADPEGSAARYKSAFGGAKNEHLLASDQVHTRPIGMREFSGTRNRRSVWTIATQPYSGAHFATMPPDLAETCIKAGSRLGDMILDPFGGAGTTALVADRLQRDATIIELNPAYAALARDRINGEAGLFAPAAE
jgi:DNA modification methylase